MAPPSPAMSECGPKQHLGSRLELCYMASTDSLAHSSIATPRRQSMPNGPHRFSSSRPSLNKVRGIPYEFMALRDFGTGGAQRVASAGGPDWEQWSNNLTSEVDAQVEAHMRICSKCRVFSVFSKSRCWKKKPPLTDLTLATLCREGMQGLDQHVQAAITSAKNASLESMAASLKLNVTCLMSFEGVADRFRDTTFASITTCAAEELRVRSQAHMRVQMLPALDDAGAAYATVSLWRAMIAPRFGNKLVPHERGSVVMGTDVEAFAAKEMAIQQAKVASQIAEWEGCWIAGNKAAEGKEGGDETAPKSFRETFSVFGEPVFDYDRRPLEVPERLPISRDWHRDIDNGLLTREEIDRAASRPIRVVVRIRPALANETGDKLTASANDNVTVTFRGAAGDGQTLEFDRVLDAPQTELFSQSGVKALVHKACEGHTATIMAYGQTGAGKTYSLLGPKDCMSQIVDDRPVLDDGSGQLLPPVCTQLVDGTRMLKVAEQGLVPRCMQFVFSVLGPSSTVKASFMEIYNERIFDLLDSSAEKMSLHQRPPPEVGFQVAGLAQVECSSAEALLQVLRQGVSARHTAYHSASPESSRAHGILTIELPRQPDGKRGGRLIFADLAGSERIKRIGTQTSETAHINKSLLMLSNCVATLSSLSSNGSGGSAVAAASSAFRNSKLTKVLMDALLGRGFMLLLANISPVERHFDETANTLAFAAKCANITRKKPEVRLPTHQRELRELQEQVNELRAQLERARQMVPANGDVEGGAPGSCTTDKGTELESLRQELEAERRQAALLRSQIGILQAEATSKRIIPRFERADPVSTTCSSSGSISCDTSAGSSGRSLPQPEVPVPCSPTNKQVQPLGTLGICPSGKGRAAANDRSMIQECR